MTDVAFWKPSLKFNPKRTLVQEFHTNEEHCERINNLLHNAHIIEHYKINF